MDHSGEERRDSAMLLPPAAAPAEMITRRHLAHTAFVEHVPKNPFIACDAQAASAWT